MNNRYNYLLKILPEIAREKPLAAIVYQFATTFKDELGSAPTTEEIAEHLDLGDQGSAIVEECFELLSKHKLVAKVAKSWILRKPSNRVVDKLSEFATKIVETRPSKQLLQRMMKPTSLKRIVKQIGPLKYWDVEALAKAYKIQPIVLTHYFAVNLDFTTRFFNLLDDQAYALWSEKKKNGKCRLDRDTFKQYYQDLLKTVTSDKGRYLPSNKGKWNSHNLLALFLWLYKRSYTSRYIFMDETRAPQQGIEIKLVLTLARERFEDNREQTAKYINWIFSEIAPKLSNPLTLKTLQHNTFVNQYLAKACSTTKLAKTTDLPKEFIEYCEQYSAMEKQITLVDLYWMREAQLDNTLEEDVTEVLNRAEELGILPKEGNIEYPGK